MRRSAPATAKQLLRTLILCLAAGIPRLVEACAVCFGSPDSPQVQGVNYAILFLLAVTSAVLAALATFFVVLWRRSRLAAMALGTDDGNLRNWRFREGDNPANNNGSTF